MRKIYECLKSHTPIGFKLYLLKIFYLFRFCYNYCLNIYSYPRIEKRLSKQEKIRVVFFVVDSAEWKADELYLLLENSSRFVPYIVICPVMTQGSDKMMKDLFSTELYFSSKKYRYYNSYNKKTHEWLDVNKVIEPDIVFYSNPYRGLTINKYYIYNYPKSLSCYIPYGYMIANIEKHQFNEYFHNLLWKGFYETTVHKKMAYKYAFNKGVNIVVTGYPQCDQFCRAIESYNSSVWKTFNNKLKKIIWAPHHAIEMGNVDISYSNFLEYADFMLELSYKYSNKIQFAFKPHPLLRYKLYEREDWGRNKTDEYFEQWKNNNNTQLEEGDYVDLFMTSDGMIMDSISFMAEYMFTEKPCLFMIKDNTKEHFNDFGKQVFDLLYHSNDKETIIFFIEEVILNDTDVMKKERLDFLNTVLFPPNHLPASLNIFNVLNKL